MVSGTETQHYIKTIFLTVLVPDFQTQHHKRIFFKKVQSERRIPFDLKLDYEPNKKTKKALMNGEYEENDCKTI